MVSGYNYGDVHVGVLVPCDVIVVPGSTNSCISAADCGGLHQDTGRYIKGGWDGEVGGMWEEGKK